MQILEASVVGLRSARYRLESTHDGVSVTLFPMVHAADAAFYEAVYDNAFSHDVVLVEGVRSPVVRRLTRSYRWIRGSRLGLTIQPKYPAQNQCQAQIVHADLSEDEFAGEWSKVSLPLRLLTTCAAPFEAVRLRWNGTRTRLARSLRLDDLPDRDEILGWSPETAGLLHAILHARDLRLIERLAETVEARRQSGSRIAVVYGAAHMPAVLRYLQRDEAFRITQSDWLTVFHSSPP